MIENLRGRSTETRYGRIPLWLYETGVGLQAIATYGWLHGRYGHYERVMPSYGTLAKELGVSRSSVIAYVQKLIAVGAVQIETSGAAGQKTNEYVIAFNAPFPAATDGPVCGGQNADQVVSGLYRSGQRADQGGQRAVHEEDVPKKTKNTFLPSGSLPATGGAAGRGRREGGGAVEAKEARPSAGMASVAAEGSTFLIELGLAEPRLNVGGKALTKHALTVQGLLANGWSVDHLRSALTAGLPAVVYDPATFLEIRLAAFPPAPVVLPRQAVPPEAAALAGTPMPRPAREAPFDPPPSCATCAGFPAPGEDQCPSCLGWPLCASGCGRRVGDGATCAECVTTALEAALRAPETADGDCPCGRPAVTLGWCSRCRVAVEAGGSPARYSV